jgi:hypothetical protein
VALTDTNNPAEELEQVKQLLDLFSAGILNQLDLVNLMPSVFSPPEAPVVQMPADELMQQMAEVQPVAEDLEQMGYLASDVADAGVIYAPYIPLYQTPTLNISEALEYHPIMPGATFNKNFGEDIYKIQKYDDIYTDIKERFNILDL